MKRLLYLTLCVLCSLTMVAADEVPTATLQHGDQMTPFFGDSAFLQANRAAVDGDVITLNASVFRGDTVRHSIRIYGEYGAFPNTSSINTYTTTVGHYTYYNDPSSKTLEIIADNVFIEGVASYRVYLWQISGFTFKRSASSVDSRYNTTHTNTLIDQCYIEDEKANLSGMNYTIKNSAIHTFSRSNRYAVNPLATITNCFVDWFYRSGNTDAYWIIQPQAVYTNCILGLDAYTEGSPEYQSSGLPEVQWKAPSEFHYNYFYRFNLEHYSEYYVPFSFASNCVNEGNEVNSANSSAVSCEGNYYDFTPVCVGWFRERTTWAPMTGSDGTPVGITGGTGYSQYPGIPKTYLGWAGQPTNIAGQLKRNIYVFTYPENPGDTPKADFFEYWIDDPYGEGTILRMDTLAEDNYSRYQLNDYTFDCSRLSAGEHILYYRARDSYGAYSPLHVDTFYRTNPYDEVMILPYEATELVGDQQTANPTYMAYPTEIEESMPPIECKDTN